jgi:hypothetical protein
MIIKLLLLLTLLISTNLFAHSGRTNINGCHVETSTNTEHCHGTVNETMTKIVEPIIEKNKIGSESESKINDKTARLNSDSKPSKMFSVMYILLFLAVVVLFKDLLKITIELFKLLYEKLESKTKHPISISILLTIMTITFILLLLKSAFY